MIRSVLLWLGTSSPDWAKPYRLAWGSVGLWSRAMRQRQAWLPHEQRCHAVIASVIAELPRHRKALVLGSGLALDIPLEAMAKTFDEVVLVDVIHLPPIRRRAKRLPNVTLLTLDLTGLLAHISGQGAEVSEPLKAFHADQTIDLTISAMCLSQLPMAIEDFLERQGRSDPALGAKLIRRHIDGLLKLPGRVVLFTDIVMEEVTREGVVTDSLDLLHGHVLPSPDDQWDWWVAPRGEKHRSRAYRHHVHAYRDLTFKCR
jgi:hypothetical protein